MPKLVAIGESWVLKGLDEALAEASAGSKLTIEVDPSKGFGNRDPDKVRMLPLRKLGEDAEKVSVGDTVEIDDRKGIIRYIGSGRVQIDFNHRYAGKTILYDVDIKKSLDSDDEKIQGIIQRHLLVQDPIHFENNADGVDIVIPKELFRIDGLQTSKYLIQLDLFKFIPTLPKINFIEVFTNDSINNSTTATATSELPNPTKEY